MEDTEFELDEDDETYTEMSVLTDVDLSYDTVDSMSLMSGHQSKAYLERRNRNLKERGTTKTVGRSDLGLDYSVDTWKDGTPNDRCSIQVHMPSGHNLHRKTTVRVSTALNELIIRIPKSANLIDTTLGILCNLEPQVASMLTYHPKVIARKASIAKLRGRDPEHAPLYLTHRIALPFKCRPKITDDTDGDRFFSGKKFVEYSDGELHLHVELIADVGDDYRATADDHSVFQARAPRTVDPDDMDCASVFSGKSHGYGTRYSAPRSSLAAAAAAGRKTTTEESYDAAPKRQVKRTAKGQDTVIEDVNEEDEKSGIVDEEDELKSVLSAVNPNI